MELFSYLFLLSYNEELDRANELALLGDFGIYLLLSRSPSL